MTIDTSKISLTTVQGILSAAAFAAIGLVPLFPAHAAWFTTGAGVLGVLKAAIGYYQQDATKPTDSKGNPVPSTEVPVTK
jgi:hypothetical protein